MKGGTAAKAGVDFRGLFQPLETVPIDGKTLTLIIGLVRSPGAASLVKGEAKPFCVMPGTAFQVQVLNAQDDLPLAGPGGGPGQKGAENIPQVHPPAGGRSKAPDRAGFGQ